MLTDHLLAAGYKVNCLDCCFIKTTPALLPYLGNPNYRSVYGDLRDQSALDRALQGVTDVILLAGLVGDPITQKYPEASHAINDEGILSCIGNPQWQGLVRDFCLDLLQLRADQIR